MGDLKKMWPYQNELSLENPVFKVYLSQSFSKDNHDDPHGRVIIRLLRPEFKFSGKIDLAFSLMLATI